MARSEVCDLLIDHSKFKTKAMCTWVNYNEFHSVYVDCYDSDIEVPENFVICGGNEG